jgi:hypothetical protein
MVAIQSNKALKYNPIQPNAEGIIELQIIDVREFLEQELCVISVQDSVIIEDVKTVLTVRSKQFTFAELDALEAVLPVSEGSYMERRLNRLQNGLLYITQNDAHPIYFSEASDWEVV